MRLALVFVLVCGVAEAQLYEYESRYHPVIDGVASETPLARVDVRLGGPADCFSFTGVVDVPITPVLNPDTFDLLHVDASGEPVRCSFNVEPMMEALAASDAGMYVARTFARLIGTEEVSEMFVSNKFVVAGVPIPTPTDAVFSSSR